MRNFGLDAMFSRAEFELAVKDALRHYARADLLAGNPLLHAQVLQQRNSEVTIQSLRAMLAETAETLFANSRDQKLYRVLDLTYLNPAPKQEAAADRLGLPFSTYRRQLTSGVGRVIDWLWQQEEEAVHRAHSTERAITPQSSGVDTTPRRLSIVVLPFLNLSHDPYAEHIANGIVDSLTTDLSRTLPGGTVISRSTAFSYKSRAVSARQIGQELKVRYVLEGSVLAEAGRIRINAQLVDSQTDEHLWAERFDKERLDILQIQDEVVARLTRSVGVEMVRHEAERSRRRCGNDCDAADLVLRGNALGADVPRKENAAEAVALFKKALTRDPDNIGALVGLAAQRTYQILNNYVTANREELLDEAEALIVRAMALAPDRLSVLKARAVLLRARGRFEEAIVAAKSVIALNPGEPTAYRELGANNLYLGATRKAVDYFRHADCIAPRDRTRWTWLQGLGRALMQLGQDAEAVEIMRVAVHENGNLVSARAYLVAAETLVGNADRAKRHLLELAELDPGLTIKRFVEERYPVPPAAISPIYWQENERILEALRCAGMPDQ